MTAMQTIMQFFQNGYSEAQSMVQTMGQATGQGRKAKGHQAKATPASLGLAKDGSTDLSARTFTEAQPTLYRLEVDATQHGAGVGQSPAIYHWRVVDAQSGLIMVYGRSRTQSKAYRKGNKALRRFIG